MQLVICDDDPLFHFALKEQFFPFHFSNFEIFSALTSESAFDLLSQNSPNSPNSIDILLLDLHLRTENEGLALIPEILRRSWKTAVIMVTGNSDFRTVRQAMRLGAVDYYVKGSDPEELVQILRRVVERQTFLKTQLDGENRAQLVQKNGFEKKSLMVGDSPQVKALRAMITKAARSHANVMITGETGTGKEVIARQLRGAQPFIPVDSSTIQSSMAESLLFGHEKGAFTGANKSTKGIFEEANGGIVYFDEISNMSLDIQAKLLRVLQEKEITRLGSFQVIPLDFRVICASNEDLEKWVKVGKFKSDLFQRLNVIPIQVPPLRERLEDLPALIDYFVRKQSHCLTPRPLGRGIYSQAETTHLGFGPSEATLLEFKEDAKQALFEYSWPGNIRELENLITYLFTMVDSFQISRSDLPPQFRRVGIADRKNLKSFSWNFPEETPQAKVPSFYEKVSEYEKVLLFREYERCHGNVKKMAQELKIDRSHLYSKLKSFGIRRVEASEL